MEGSYRVFRLRASIYGAVSRRTRREAEQPGGTAYVLHETRVVNY